MPKSYDIEEGKSLSVQEGEHAVVVFQLEGKQYKYRDFCPHRGGALSEGTIEGEFVTCPWHFAKFNIKTGAVVEGPCSRGLIPAESSSSP